MALSKSKAAIYMDFVKIAFKDPKFLASDSLITNTLIEHQHGSTQRQNVQKNSNQQMLMKKLQ